MRSALCRVERFIKLLVSIAAAVCSERLRKHENSCNNPQPNCDGSDHHSAISHNRVISQGVFDGDNAFDADQS